MLRLASILLIVASVAATATAQATTGAIVGRVTDQFGRGVGDVIVRLVDTRTGFRYATKSDESGTYRVDFLLPSVYDITAEKSGYETGRISNFRAEVASTREIIPPPITLISAGSAATAPADTARDQVRTGSTDLQFHIDAGVFDRLPLPGFRSLDALALLAPGVARAPETRGLQGPGVGAGVGTAGTFSVHGLRSRSNNFTWDGADNNDQDVGTRRQGFLLPAPVTLSAVSEFEITTLIPTAGSGRTLGATVNLVTRIGSNRPSGDAYAFGTGRALSARDPFDAGGAGNPEENPFSRLQFGLRGGAKIVPDRVHLFGAFERARLSAVRDIHFAVPTELDRSQAFRTAGRSTDLGEDLLSTAFLPLPNNPGGPRGARTLTRALDASGSGNLGVARLDAQTSVLGRPSTITFRASFTSDRARIPATDEALSSEIEARSRTANTAASFSLPLSDSISTQVRFSWGQTSVDFAEVAGSPFVFASPAGLSGPVGRIRFDPYSPIGVDPSVFPQDRNSSTLTLASATSAVHGDHTLRLGGEVRRVGFSGRLDRNYRAEIAFTSGYTNDFLEPERTSSGLVFAAVGLPSNIFQTLAVEPDSALDLGSTELSAFFEDSWKVRPNLLVSFGLRYDYAAPPTSDSGALERRLVLGLEDVPGYDPTVGASEFFGRAYLALERILDGRTRIYDADRNNFGPRVGVVWDPTRRGAFAMRGGYALVYDVPLGTLVSQSRNTFPAYVPLNFGSTALFPSLLTRNPVFLPGPVVRPGTLNTFATTAEGLPEVLGGLFFVEQGSLAFTLPERRFRTAYAHEGYAGVETLLPGRSRLRVLWVGTFGRSLARLALPNGGPYTSARYLESREDPEPLFDQADRPDPDLGAWEEFRSDASSCYNALETEFETTAVAGLLFRASYTWSHSIDNATDIFSTSGGSSVAQDELGRVGGLGAERSSSSIDVRHRLAAHFVWDLERLGYRPLAGFALSGVVELASGQPYTIVTSIDSNLDGVLTDRLKTTAGLVFHDSGSELVSVLPGTDLQTLIVRARNDRPKTSALGRNAFRGRGIANVDLALSRTFEVRGARLELRLEAFNVFNRPHYGLPVRVLESPGFGSSTETSLPARIVQVGFRIGF